MRQHITLFVSAANWHRLNIYIQRYDNVARIVHWNLTKLHRLDVAEKWYDHKLEGVMESDGAKLLWDFNIQTDKEIQARRPDLVVVNRRDNQCLIIDIAVPNDSGIFGKEKEKIEKYQDQRREIECDVSSVDKISDC